MRPTSEENKETSYMQHEQELTRDDSSIAYDSVSHDINSHLKEWELMDGWFC